MRAMLAVVLSIVLTVCSWGLYVTVVHKAQPLMGGGLRPFMCVGLAYFGIAVIVPAIILAMRGESGRWTRVGTTYSLVAGMAGALGALGIILAKKAGGNALMVAPLVFGAAPVINTLTTMFMTKSFRQIRPMFLLGLVMVIAGSLAVLYFRPQASEARGTGFFDSLFTSGWVIFWIGFTALFWGVYGPVLHKGQATMQGSRLRPFLCVGIAYLVVAVCIPSMLLSMEAGDWSTDGSLLSLAAGAAGAIGALGIIMAFNFGGKPVYVMPLVFGGAPVVNTIISLIWTDEPIGTIDPWFYAGLVVVALGAVIVLVFAPRPQPPRPVGKSRPLPAKAAS